MRESMTIRLDPGVVAAAKRRAQRENRTLTNYIETVLRRDLRLTEDDRTLSVIAPADIRDYAPVKVGGESERRRRFRRELHRALLSLLEPGAEPGGSLARRDQSRRR
jgi:hypothetical protein